MMGLESLFPLYREKNFSEHDCMAYFKKGVQNESSQRGIKKKKEQIMDKKIIKTVSLMQTLSVRMKKPF